MILLYIYTVCSLMTWAVLVDDSIKRDYSFEKPLLEWTVLDLYSNLVIVLGLLPVLSLFWPLWLYFVYKRIVNGKGS